MILEFPPEAPFPNSKKFHDQVSLGNPVYFIKSAVRNTSYVLYKGKMLPIKNDMPQLYL
jgi:hypothetical protein